MSITLFSLSALITIILFLAVRCNLDFSAIAISIAYLVGIALRTPLLSDSDFNLLHSIASMTTWMILYYFAFEMKYMEDKLRSQSFEENLKKARRTRISKYLVFILFFSIIVFSVFVLYITKMKHMDFYLRYQSYFDVMLIIRGIVKLCIDSYLFR